jgi:hypothetical protein
VALLDCDVLRRPRRTSELREFHRFVWFLVGHDYTLPHRSKRRRLSCHVTLSVTFYPVHILLAHLKGQPL